MPELKILNHNIYFKPIGFNTTANEYKRERAALYIEAVKDFDILNLQEVFKSMNPGFHQFLKDLDRVGFKYYVRGE